MGGQTFSPRIYTDLTDSSERLGHEAFRLRRENLRRRTAGGDCLHIRSDS